MIFGQEVERGGVGEGRERLSIVSDRITPRKFNSDGIFM